MELINKFLELLYNVNNFINDIVWGVPMMILIFGVGIYFTFKLDFIQFKKIKTIFKETIVKAFKKKDESSDKGELTSFQAAMVSISAIVGSGNIAGIATAIVIGGPGVIVWMIVAAFIGMATKFAEITLGIKYREVNKDGSVNGGTMYYLDHGVGKHWLGVLFTLLMIPCCFVISGLVDSNTIALTVLERYAVPTWITGAIMATLAGIIIFGGVKRVGRACELISPFMCGAYILAGLLVIFLNISSLPSALATIIEAAFNPRAITGGAVGSIFMVMRYGIARGMFSNEAGLGTAAMAHCTAKVDHPVEQALWAPIEVFLDTVVIGTITALTVVLSGLYTSGLDGAALTMRAFDALLPGSLGGLACFGSVMLFGFSCLISYYTYAEKAASYIWGSKCKLPIRILWVIFIFIGAQVSIDLVWELADTLNGLMIIPNLFGLVFLSKEIIKLKKEYFKENI